MGKRPQQVRLYDPDRGRHGIFVTMAELQNWAYNISMRTQEGEPYHDANDLMIEAYHKIAEFFDGSKGTYIDIMTGEARPYPIICTWEDIRNYFGDDYNIRMLGTPLFSRSYNYTDDNDAQWYHICRVFHDRVIRFCKFNNIRYTKLIQTMMIEYNPIADYWTNEKKIDANAPYITIANNKNSTSNYAMNPMVADWNQVAGSVDGADNPMDIHGHNAYKSRADQDITNKHYTTTYDNAAESRLESYDEQSGGTENVLPSSGSFSKREEEGNKGTVSPQDMVIKEFDIAQLWNIVEVFMNDLSKEVYLNVYWDP